MALTKDTHIAVTEDRIIQRIKEWREPLCLLDGLGTRSDAIIKTREQLSSERAFIEGMCSGAFNFLGDLTPISTWTRLAKRTESHDD